MEKKNNILIIPDVHGREFWKNPVIKELGKVEKNSIFRRLLRSISSR